MHHGRSHRLDNKSDAFHNLLASTSKIVKWVLSAAKYGPIGVDAYSCFSLQRYSDISDHFSSLMKGVFSLRILKCTVVILLVIQYSTCM